MLQPTHVRPSVLLDGVRYPEEERLRRYVADGFLTGETLVGAFRQSFQDHYDRLALVGPEGEYTYRGAG
ncbi:hypothetical protein ACTMU2_13535 [Cupriavidus basilensis]